MILNYYRYEPDAPASEPAVLIHGFAATGMQLWGTTGWVKQLTAQRIPTLVVDLPYHGPRWLSPGAPQQLAGLQPDGQITLDSPDLITSTAAGIARLADILDRRIHLIGFSAGARIAYETASSYPAKVLSLTVGGLPNHDYRESLSTYLAALNAGTPIPDSTLSNPDFAAIIANSPVAPQALEKFVRAAGPFTVDPSKYQPLCPVQIVSGSQDTIAGDSSWLARELGTTTTPLHYLTIEGRNHINILTSRMFKNAAITWILDHSPTASSSIG